MVDKIYSRPRIKIKKFKNMNKKQKIKFILLNFFIMLIIFSIFLIKAAYPVFLACCENAAISSATNILNKEVNEVMLVYNYDDLVNLGKDEKRQDYLYWGKYYTNKWGSNKDNKTYSRKIRFKYNDFSKP